MLDSQAEIISDNLTRANNLDDSKLKTLPVYSHSHYAVYGGNSVIRCSEVFHFCTAMGSIIGLTRKQTKLHLYSVLHSSISF